MYTHILYAGYVVMNVYMKRNLKLRFWDHKATKQGDSLEIVC